MKPETQLALHEAAVSVTPTYCKAVHHPDGRVEERTPWQDGWNEAKLAILKNVVKLEDWFTALTPQQQECVETLLHKDELLLDIHNDHVHMLLCMNDVFGYACSESEVVELEELPEVADVFSKYGWDGLKAWASIKSSQVPIDPCITDKYKEAIKYLRSNRVVT